MRKLTSWNIFDKLFIKNIKDINKQAKKQILGFENFKSRPGHPSIYLNPQAFDLISAKLQIEMRWKWV